jgi:hypothetical protein
LKLFIFRENIEHEIEKLKVAKRGASKNIAEMESRCVLEFHQTIDACKKWQLKVLLLNNKFVLELLAIIHPFGQKS